MNTQDLVSWYLSQNLQPQHIGTLVWMVAGVVQPPSGVPGSVVLGVLLEIRQSQGETWARVRRGGQAYIRSDGTATRGQLCQVNDKGEVSLWVHPSVVVGEALSAIGPGNTQSVYLQPNPTAEGNGGGGLTGDHNAIAFFLPDGSNITDDPALTAAPPDQFGRPQILDRRLNQTTGPVFRQGGWQSDGDPVDQGSEGIVLYGPSVNGNLNAGEGAYGRVKWNRFGFFTILPGGPAPGYYQWRIDTTELYAKKDDASGTRTFEIQRSTGTLQTAGNVLPYTDNTGTVGGLGQRWNELRSVWVYTSNVDTDTASPLKLANVNATSLEVGNSAGNFQIFINQGGAALHGSNAGLQYASLVANRAQLRCNLYGANTGAPGITGFKSRGATVGSLAAVADGDCLWRATAIGVAGDNASIPLAALASVYVPTGGIVGGQGWVSTRFELELTPLNGPTNNHRATFGVTSEGALVMRETPGALGGPVAAGVVVLAAGASRVVANAAVTAQTRITLTIQAGGPAPTGSVYVSAVVPGVSFTIRSTSAGDVGIQVYYQFWEAY